jgi:hypothetical protein
VVNRSAEPARVLILSTLNVPKAAFYPDSDKVRIRRSLNDRVDLPRAAAVDYWEGES